MFQPTRRFLSLSMFLVLGSLLLPQLCSGQSTIVSNDPNFSPAVLTPGLSFPDGVVFRPPTGDLLVSQGNQISIVNATSGAISHNPFATPALPDKIAVRASDGLVAALTTGPNGPILFYNSTGGTSIGSIDQTAILSAFPTYLSEISFLCLSGLSFDTMGNLFVAAGHGSGPLAGNGCFTDHWAIYKFAGPTPYTAIPTQVTTFGSVLIQDMAFSAAKPPSGTLWAIDSANGGVYEIPLCTECSKLSISTVSTAANPRGIAIDPLLGDIYITEFVGHDILRVPAPGPPSDPRPIIFATGFSHTGETNTFNSLRLAFDSNGNLYVNESNGGNLWKFTRASNATTQQPLTPGKINTFTFANPNAAMSDQIQTMLIPASANYCDSSGRCAAFIQDIFVSVDPNTLNTTLANGTTGDTAFFGGSPVLPGATCIQVPSANNNCVVVVQKCFDANHVAFDVCPIHKPLTSADLLQATFSYAGTLSATDSANSAFLIGFDTGDGSDITDITIQPFTGEPKGGGGSNSWCSKTFGAIKAPNSVFADFSLSVSPSPVDLTASNPNSATVTVTSLNGFASTVTLGLSDVPAGFSATLNKTMVTPPANGFDSSTTLTVGISASATTSGIATIIGNLLTAGCIDNAGIAKALTSKLSAAQMDISAGQIKTAINVLMALRDQVQAQTDKHIAASCTTVFPLIVTGTVGGELRSTSVNVTFAPATVLTAGVGGLIASLKLSVSAADPITGFVVDSTGAGVSGATVSLGGSTAVTDLTGFYYFATTGSLTVGSSYTVQVTVFPFPFAVSAPPSQTFTWGSKGLTFNFTLQ